MNSSDFIKLEFKNLKPFEIFDYFDGPRFYSCKSPTNQLYLIYWVDENEGNDEWLYVKISHERYYSMKSKFFNIRDAFLKPEDGYVFYVSVSSKEDFVIEYKLPETIDIECLPEEDEFIEMDDLSNINLLPKKLSNTAEASESSYRHVVDFALVTQNNSYEIPASTLGPILTKFQGFIDALGCDSVNPRRVPDDIKDSHVLNVTSLFASSFGVRLQSKNSDFFSDSKLELSVKSALNILDTLGCEDSLYENLNKMNLLTRSRFKGFLTELVTNKLSLKTEYSNPLGSTSNSNSKYPQLKSALKTLTTSFSSNTQTKTYKNVILVGVDVNSDFFAIKLSCGKLLKGKLSKKLESSNFTIPSKLTVTIEETCKVNEHSDDEKWTYTLISFVK
ncbi:DUF6575 domain-containing protein [Photobacterium damselae]|uniref:DUF6575 domain-containing protein n=1 Tax=Photobacterium damselae TaxID=38293 RepID=UPI0040685351